MRARVRRTLKCSRLMKSPASASKRSSRKPCVTETSSTTMAAAAGAAAAVGEAAAASTQAPWRTVAVRV